MGSKNLSLIIKVIIGLMLLLALADWQYSYYEVLRVVVCTSSVYLAYDSYDKKRIVWTCIFIALAILFNPIIPIYLQKETWRIVDFVAALLVLASIFFDKKVTSNKSSD